MVLRANGARGAQDAPATSRAGRRRTSSTRRSRNAKPLPLRRMMVHHFLIFAPGRVDQAPGSCWGQSGFIGGRGEEHPIGKVSRVRHIALLPAALRDQQPPPRRQRPGLAPDRDGDEPLQAAEELLRAPPGLVRHRRAAQVDERPPSSASCSHGLNGMSYDVPGGGRRGSNFVEQEPLDVAATTRGSSAPYSHQHGGRQVPVAARASPATAACSKRPPTTARAKHIYNRIRPILHEPGPIGNGAYASVSGIPLARARS